MNVSSRRPSSKRPPGSEAAHPRSDLEARLVMSRIALPFFVVSCAICALAAADDVADARGFWIVAAIVCAATVLIAWIDIVVVLRRRRAERRTLPPAGRRG
jgi:hypothetical protein